jgi:ABC-type amino acid transport substrate-binding protein
MRYFLLAIILSIVTAYATVTLTTPEHMTKKETVYDRVMRTGFVRAGYYPWPSYFDIDPVTKEITGSSKELCDAIFKMLGLKVEYVEISANIVQDLESEKIDARCADSPWMLPTIKHIDYTSAFYSIPNYIFVRSDETRFTQVADLDQKEVRFVGLDGDLSTELVQLNFPKAVLSTYPLSTESSQLLLNLTGNKADAFITDPALVAVFNKGNKDQLEPLFDKPFTLNPAGFSVKKGEVKWFQTLDYAVKMAHNVGLIEPILDKYDPEKTKLIRVTPR